MDISGEEKDSFPCSRPLCLRASKLGGMGAFPNLNAFSFGWMCRLLPTAVRLGGRSREFDEEEDEIDDEEEDEVWEADKRLYRGRLKYEDWGAGIDSEGDMIAAGGDKGRPSASRAP